jgi:hypothetical protein
MRRPPVFGRRGLPVLVTACRILKSPRLLYQISLVVPLSRNQVVMRNKIKTFWELTERAHVLLLTLDLVATTVQVKSFPGPYVTLSLISSLVFPT